MRQFASDTETEGPVERQIARARSLFLSVNKSNRINVTQIGGQQATTSRLGPNAQINGISIMWLTLSKDRVQGSQEQTSRCRGQPRVGLKLHARLSVTG